MSTPVTSHQKTAYFVTDADGNVHDDHGHIYFTKALARTKARQLGGMYHDAPRDSVKNVVTGYTEG